MSRAGLLPAPLRPSSSPIPMTPPSTGQKAASYDGADLRTIVLGGCLFAINCRSICDHNPKISICRPRVNGRRTSRLVTLNPTLRAPQRNLTDSGSLIRIAIYPTSMVAGSGGCHCDSPSPPTSQRNRENPAPLLPNANGNAPEAHRRVLVVLMIDCCRNSSSYLTKLRTLTL